MSITHGSSARCAPRVGHAPFGRLVAEVMGHEPYRSARRVFWVLDNGTSHRGQPAITRLEGAYPNLTVVHLPVHASWLNQIEIYFSILQRKALTPMHVVDPDQLAARIMAFQAEFAASARPFDWRFTRRELDALLARIDERGRPLVAA